MRQNCWEFKKCGRQPGGARVADLGTCAAATEAKANKLNDGCNGGRICWAIAGTLCGGKVQGTFSEKLGSCIECEFYRQVHIDQGKDTQSVKALLQR